jgi:hypothetical protein
MFDVVDPDGIQKEFAHFNLGGREPAALQLCPIRVRWQNPGRSIRTVWP